MKTRLYLIRHAESDYNKNHSHKVGGQSKESPLSLEGTIQANLLGKRLSCQDMHFDSVYCSMAIRAKETARISLEYINYSQEKIIYSERLLELDQGDWVGKFKKDIYTPEMLKIINEDPWNFAAPAGESQHQVEDRIRDYLTQEILSKDSSSVAIYGHGLAFRCFLRGVLDFDAKHTYGTELENTSISEFEYDKGNFRLVRWNDFSHLGR